MTVKSPNSSPPSNGGPSSKNCDVSLKNGAEARYSAVANTSGASSATTAAAAVGPC